MKEQTLKTRIKHKTGKYADWEKAANSFKPLLGEIIVYIPDDANDTRPTRLKVGDGEKFINELNFITNPEGGGNAPGGNAAPQVQTDYSQNDPAATDYIKNRPFYALPAEYNFDLGLNRTFEEYVWDGDIKNRPNFSIEFQGTKVSWYKVSDTFYGYEDILNGYAYISAVPEDEFEEMREEQGVQSYLIPIPLTEDVLNNILLYTDSHYLIGMGAVSTDTPGILPLPDGNGGTVEFDIPEPGTYYTYDETGDLFGEIGSYTKQIVGPADILNDPNFMIAPDIYGTGTYLAFKKVSDLFFDQTSLLNTFFTMNMISYDPNDMFNGTRVQYKVSKDMLDDMDAITSSTDNSYALTVNRIPLFASFETDLGEINGMTPGKGTYLMYSDMGSAEGGMVLYLDNFNSGEIIYQIDSKYIPKQRTSVPDYDEQDPASNSYIANKPYYSYDYYNYYNGDISDTSLRVGELVTEDNVTIFYQWGYELSSSFKNPALYGKGNSDICCSKASLRNLETDNSQTIENLSTTTSDKDKVIIIYRYDSGNVPIAYITMEDDVTDKVLVYGENWDTKSITFPKKGIYYFCQTSEDGFVHVSQLQDLKRHRNNLPTSSAIDYVSPDSTSPITSGAVYTALDGRTNISITDYISEGSDQLPTSNAVYDALQNVKVSTDSSVSSSSTNPIQSKAIYTALGNRISLPIISPTVSSESENIMTSGGVYTALGNRTSITTQAPTSGSNNLITSGQVYTALGGSSISTTSNVQSNSSSLMTSKGVYAALGNRTSLTFDDTPISDSSNLMTSGAIYNALQNVEVDVENEVISDSENAVSSAAVYTALQNVNADTIDGYHFNVSTEIPTSNSVTDYTITFVI